MRTSIITAVIVQVLLTGCSSGRSPDNVITDLGDKTSRQNADVLIIYYEHDTGNAPLLEAIKKHKAEIIYEYSIVNAVAIRLHHTHKSEKAVEAFAKVRGVISVQRDKTVSID